MRSTRIIALAAGCLAVVPGAGLLVGGGALGIASLVARDDQGYFDTTLDPLATETAAITSDEVNFAADPGSPDWLMDRFDIDVRLRVAAGPERTVFVGIARTADVDAYLDGVTHAQVTDVTDGNEPVSTIVPGDAATPVTAPTDEDFWVASATGSGEQQLVWEAEAGRWTAVIMNADGSTGVRADANVAVKAGFVVPLALTLLGIGALLTAIAVALIVFGARGMRRDEPHVERAATFAPPVPGAAGRAGTAATGPVQVQATLDPDLSRWRWLVKWFLAIPHFVALALLWVVFAVTTVIAWFAILFTGRYPRSLFDVNLGVLRWTWRVQYYATSGGLGTDRYPPFSLGRHPEYPATLDIAYPEHLSRGLVLVKSWLLALPHLLLLGLLVGGAGGDGDGWTSAGGGVLGLLVLFAAVALLFTGRYPRSLFDLVVGLNRWMYRVIAYVALMTDEYPPFRLDQGGTDPTAPAPMTPAPAPPMTPADDRPLVDA